MIALDNALANKNNKFSLDNKKISSYSSELF